MDHPLTAFLRKHMHIALSMALMLLLLLLTSCRQEPHESSILRTAQERGSLRVVTLNSPSTVYEGRNGLTGFEYDLASAYAKHLGLDLQLVVASNVEEVLNTLTSGQADIAAAELTVTDGRNEHFRFSTPYMHTDPLVVCNRTRTRDKDEANLDLVLALGSSFSEALDDSGLHFAQVKAEPYSVEALLRDVAKGKADCTMADSHVYDLQRRYLPTLQKRYVVAEQTDIAWAVAGGHTWRNVSLLRDLDYWLAQDSTQKLVQRLEQRYFSFGKEEFDYVDLARLRRAIRNVLPRYEADFKRAGKRYNLPWEELAAIAWQESRWRPDAQSHTGVRGMMMLTQVTADEQGVHDRTDAAQSIMGGARYLASLKRQLPDSIPSGERLKFALAAYNMGMGHVMDARQLTKWRGKNPDKWSDVSPFLPLLQEKKVYKQLLHGYARGIEAQEYVAAVRNFADIIEKAVAPALVSSDDHADGTEVVIQGPEGSPEVPKPDDEPVKSSR